MGHISLNTWASYKDVKETFIEGLPEYIEVKKSSGASSKTWFLLHCKKNQKDFIILLLISRHDGEFYLKEIEHDMHPHYYSCPVSYLTKNLIENSTQHGENWIELVKATDAKKKETKLFKKSLRVNMVIAYEGNDEKYQLEYKRKSSWIARRVVDQQLVELPPRFLSNCKEWY